MNDANNEKLGVAGTIAQMFVRSKLTPLLVLASLFLGLFAAVLLPREEEPQISVPMFDVMVPFPGARPAEIDERLCSLGQRKLMEIPGVEYVYSTAESNFAMFIVRFKVGFNAEEAMTLLNTKVSANADFFPQGAGHPLIKPRAIDDVPVLAVTFHSEQADARALRRMAALARDAVSSVTDVSEITLVGGHKRQFMVRFDPAKLAARRITPLQLAGVLGQSNQKLPAGRTENGKTAILVETDSFIRTVQDLKSTIVGVWDGHPVYLSDVAAVSDSADDIQSDVVFYNAGDGRPREAVTMSVAKRKGSNATRVAEHVLARLNELKAQAESQGIEWSVTRNYGETAKEKSDELLFHMLLATLSVTILIALALGMREALVVFVAVPVTLGLTLLVYYVFGYTLNRITLFALIFSIGILVDDAIVVVENIHRHCVMDPECPKWKAALRAVDEVGNPTILATLTVIAAILPMAFVSGMMGPYMMPIPVGASAAMILSLAVAFIVSPWMFSIILERWAPKKHCAVPSKSLADRLYERFMRTLFASKKAMYASLAVTAALVLFSGWLFLSGRVQAKMLPFDNKNEFQVIINMPENSSYELTRQAAGEMAGFARTIPEAVNVQAYTGASAPYNFNGLVRHYFMRSRPWQADLQVNLLPRHDRKRQSHEIAAAVRPEFEKIAARYGARIQVAEVPPGPPVLATLVLEVYHDDDAVRNEFAKELQALLRRTSGIVDVDSYIPAPQPQTTLAVDRQKATLNGISSADVAVTANAALSGMSAGLAHVSGEPEPVEINLRLPQAQRASLDWLKTLKLYTPSGVALALDGLVRKTDGEAALPVYRKNLQKVTYVTADVSGRLESPVYAIAELRGQVQTLADQKGLNLVQYYTRQPDASGRDMALKWDGEWQVTYEVFRDMGISFAVVLVLIYALVVGWFGSFVTPLVIMVPIPLTLIGVLPGHWLMGTFFSATSMIGFIAGAGIVVRNSIILVDFIELRMRQGATLEDACIDAGLARFRPMLLTAAAVVVAGGVILFDPIFQGLAVALIGGAIASTLLSRTSVPALYWLFNKNKGGAK